MKLPTVISNLVICLAFQYSTSKTKNIYIFLTLLADSFSIISINSLNNTFLFFFLENKTYILIGCMGHKKGPVY